MRWHPLMVKWCLYLRHKSSSAYKLLRESGCLTLPSQRTLRDYTHHVKTTVGFSAEVDRQLIQAAQSETCLEFQKCILLLIDKMYVQEELVYQKKNGSLVGFVNMGDINTHLLDFESSLKEDGSCMMDHLSLSWQPLWLCSWLKASSHDSASHMHSSPAAM